MIKNLTIIVPTFNEEKGLSEILPQLISCAKKYENWHIIVVDDGSTDKTVEIASRYIPSIRVISHKKNRGYGAAIKTGIRLAQGSEWIATFDSDGQHQVSDLEKLANSITENDDAVIGERANLISSTRPLNRLPGKFLLRIVAQLITGRKIKDINCGLRIVKRSAFLKIFGLLCDRFSFSTTTLIALLNTGFEVKFASVSVNSRTIGSKPSTVRQINDGFETIILMLRLITLFDPLRIFLPPALFMIGLGSIYQIYQFFIKGITIHKSAILIITSGLLCFFFGLLQDQIASLRRELSSFEADLNDTKENNYGIIEHTTGK